MIGHQEVLFIQAKGLLMNAVRRMLKCLTRAAPIACMMAGSCVALNASAQTRAALVRDTDNAALAPAVLCQSVAGLSANGVVNFLGAVPSGKRFVVQHVSYTATNSTGNSIFNASLVAYIASSNSYVPKLWLAVDPPRQTSSGVVQEASLAATTYYEAGESGQLVIADNGANAYPNVVSACITGYYVTP